MLMANRSEPCDVVILIDSETWHLTERWLKPGSRAVAWWDGHTHRDGTTFWRIFSPFELAEKGITERDLEDQCG